jgi:hypothetical protein
MFAVITTAGILSHLDELVSMLLLEGGYEPGGHECKLGKMTADCGAIVNNPRMNNVPPITDESP